MNIRLAILPAVTLAATLGAGSAFAATACPSPEAGAVAAPLADGSGQSVVDAQNCADNAAMSGDNAWFKTAVASKTPPLRVGDDDEGEWEGEDD